MNGRGMALFSSIMKPSDGTRIRAVVFFCHGFLGSSSYLIRCEYQRLVKEGIAFVGIDYEGHGQSDGLQGLIPSWELLVNDSLEYFQETLKKEFPNKPYFLCGEVRGNVVWHVLLKFSMFTFTNTNTTHFFCQSQWEVQFVSRSTKRPLSYGEVSYFKHQCARSKRIWLVKISGLCW